MQRFRLCLIVSRSVCQTPTHGRKLARSVFQLKTQRQKKIIKVRLKYSTSGINPFSPLGSAASFGLTGRWIVELPLVSFREHVPYCQRVAHQSIQSRLFFLEPDQSRSGSINRLVKGQREFFPSNAYANTHARTHTPCRFRNGSQAQHPSVWRNFPLQENRRRRRRRRRRREKVPRQTENCSRIDKCSRLGSAAIRLGL